MRLLRTQVEVERPFFLHFSEPQFPFANSTRWSFWVVNAWSVHTYSTGSEISSLHKALSAKVDAMNEFKANLRCG